MGTKEGATGTFCLGTWSYGDVLFGNQGRSHGDVLFGNLEPRGRFVWEAAIPSPYFHGKRMDRDTVSINYALHEHLFCIIIKSGD